MKELVYVRLKERMCYQFFVILMCRLFYFLENNFFEVPAISFLLF